MTKGTDQIVRKLAAILSTDVKGYSRLMGDGEIATVETIQNRFIDTLKKAGFP